MDGRTQLRARGGKGTEPNSGSCCADECGGDQNPLADAKALIWELGGKAA